MERQPPRLRSGEVAAGAGGVMLLVVMLALPWYAPGGRLSRATALPSSVDGFDGLTTLRWLMLVTIAAALALAWFQATRRAPALPVSLSVIVTALGALTVLGLVYRVLINVPGPDSRVDAKAGAYLGLLAAVVLATGGFRSLREEDRPDPARTASIPVVDLARRR